MDVSSVSNVRTAASRLEARIGKINSRLTVLANSPTPAYQALLPLRPALTALLAAVAPLSQLRSARPAATASILKGTSVSSPLRALLGAANDVVRAIEAYLDQLARTSVPDSSRRTPPRSTWDTSLINECRTLLACQTAAFQLLSTALSSRTTDAAEACLRSDEPQRCIRHASRVPPSLAAPPPRRESAAAILSRPPVITEALASPRDPAVLATKPTSKRDNFPVPSTRDRPPPTAKPARDFVAIEKSTSSSRQPVSNVSETTTSPGRNSANTSSLPVPEADDEPSSGRSSPVPFRSTLKSFMRRRKSQQLETPPVLNISEDSRDMTRATSEQGSSSNLAVTARQPASAEETGLQPAIDLSALTMGSLTSDAKTRARQAKRDATQRFASFGTSDSGKLAWYRCLHTVCYPPSRRKRNATKENGRNGAGSEDYAYVGPAAGGWSSLLAWKAGAAKFEVLDCDDELHVATNIDLLSFIPAYILTIRFEAYTLATVAGACRVLRGSAALSTIGPDAQRLVRDLQRFRELSTASCLKRASAILVVDERPATMAGVKRTPDYREAQSLLIAQLVALDIHPQRQRYLFFSPDLAHDQDLVQQLHFVLTVTNNLLDRAQGSFLRGSESGTHVWINGTEDFRVMESS